MVPADLCASPTEITLFLAFARAQGFGQLAGLDQVLRTKFEGLEQICLADVVHQVFRTIAAVRSAGITLTGRAEVELGLMLVFGDPAPAAEVRGVMADLVQALQVLPQNLDVLERDWPVIIAALAKRVDLGTLRSALRNPALKHVTVGGEGTTFELRVRVEESDVRAAVDATQQLLTRLVAKE
jgi:signal transduction histidine kinase